MADPKLYAHTYWNGKGKYPDIQEALAKLIIIGRVSGALKKAGQADKAKEFSTKAMHSGSYDEVLQLAMTYCDVG